MDRIILHINQGSDGILALRAARRLMNEGHRSRIYGYENGVSIYTYATQTGVAAREHKVSLPNDCPGHVARDDDKKVCRHCGTHVDEYRDDPEDCGQ